ncbi:MAG: YceI family protein, partial [Myxococcales bacterium]|nr:YceI family protein [Myxococcales bacterium]
MNRVFAHLVTGVAVASLTLFAVGCGKKEEPKPETTPPPATETTPPPAEADTTEPVAEADTAAPVEADSAEPAAAPDAEAAAAPESEAAAAADAEAAAAMPEEYIQFHIMHQDAAKGPVDGHFETFELKAANTDLEHPENAMAKIAIDISSIKTGVDKRDGHLKSADFFDA